MHKLILSAAVSGLLLNGCAKPDPEPEGVIPQHQLEAMDKAAATEQVLEDAAAARLEAMDAAEN